jgi:hypothetical protein
MSELKMRVVDFEEKSVAEVEQELIDAAGIDEGNKDDVEATIEVNSDGAPIETGAEDTGNNFEIDDDVVLSHIKTKYNKEISSIEDLFKEPEIPQVMLDSDVEAFQKYKKETGRGIEDFYRLQQDFEKMPEDQLLVEFYRSNGEDDEDIEYRMRKMAYDEDLDSEDEIAEKRLARKQELKKAKKFLGEQKEKYSIPLESRESAIPEADLQDYEAYKSNKTMLQQQQEDNAKKQKYFAEQTDKLFSDKFEGFGFNLDVNNKVVYKPADAKSLKDESSLNNLIGSFINEDGYLKDAELFHRAITIAKDPDKFAKFFYDKGKADAVTGFDKDSKNIDMVRTAGSPPPSEGGLKFKVVDTGYSNKLTIKKR